MKTHRHPLLIALLSIAATFATPEVRADAVTDWNRKCGELITDAKLGTPPAARVMAIVQTAAMQAVAAAQRSQASAEAALAAAHHVALTRLLPAQQPAIDAAYQAALGALPDNEARSRGIAAGQAAAQAVLAARLDDGSATPETYRPVTRAGAYVPTAPVAVPQWAQRTPWLMRNAAQFRPAPPPALDSAQWARDFEEVRTLGGRTSSRRSAAQTDAARFWDYSLPAIYHGVVRSVAQQPQRDLARNARLFAAVAQAMDDALIAIFDAKYHYQFWRPVTAIRNGDLDGNDATPREASWLSLIDAPLHPEYPSGHSILAASVAALIDADAKGGALPELSTSSPTAQGATRRWQRTDQFVREVSDSRVHGGIHFRSATDAAEAMGRRIGELAAQRVLDPAPWIAAARPAGSLSRRLRQRAPGLVVGREQVFHLQRRQRDVQRRAEAGDGGEEAQRAAVGRAQPERQHRQMARGLLSDPGLQRRPQFVHQGTQARQVLGLTAGAGPHLVAQPGFIDAQRAQAAGREHGAQQVQRLGQHGRSCRRAAPRQLAPLGGWSRQRLDKGAV